MPSILLVVNDPSLLACSREAVQALGGDAREESSTATALSAVSDLQPSIALIEASQSDASGLGLLTEIRVRDPHLPVMILTARPGTELAIEAMKRGAFDILAHPFQATALADRMKEAIQARDASIRRPSVQVGDLGEISMDALVGRTIAMQELCKSVGRVAPTDVNVLVQGESGTGKELVARAIHRHSRRSRGPFVAVNCAAIPDSLLESELFGHERGAFTGAEQQRIGRFEQADQGTILLDEIGDMTGPTQAKVLRILQNQQFERVGGNKTIQAHARVVAATNQNLDELVAAGRFRRDLFYRLRVYTIQVPALRERMEDLPLLIEHFLQVYRQEVGRDVNAVSEETLELLSRYSWPGNIRELQGAIKFAMVNAVNNVIAPGNLPGHIRHGAVLTSQLGATPAEKLNVVELARRLLADGEMEIHHNISLAVDRALLEEVMKFVHGNQVEAARRLGISRTTLRAKLRALELTGLSSRRPPLET